MVELYKILGVVGLALAAAAWLAREIVRFGLQRQADRLGEGLRRETALALEQIKKDSALAVEQVRSSAILELERYKNDLTMRAEEHRVRFSKLQEKRVEILGRLYSQLAEFMLQASLLKIEIDMTFPIEDKVDSAKKGKVNDIYEILQSLLSVYKEAELYLPAAISEKIWRVLSPSDAGLRRAKAAVQYESMDIKGLKSALSSISIASSIREVIPEFHEMLGVES